MIDKKVLKALEKSGVPYEIREFPDNFKNSEDAKVDHDKYKKKFKVPIHRLDEEDLMELTGFVPGAVSPIGIAYKRAKIYMDESLKSCMDELVYPSGGYIK